MSDSHTKTTRALARSLAVGTGLYGLAVLAQRAASLLMLPVNTRFLQVSDFGLLDLIEQVGSLVAIFFGANLSVALAFFYARETTPEGRDTVVTTVLGGSLLIGLLGGLVTSLASWWGGHWIASDPAFPAYLAFSMAWLPLHLLAEVLFSWLRVVDRPGVFVVGSLLRLGLSVGTAIILLVVYRMRVWGVIWSVVLAVTVTTAALGVYWWRTGRTGREPRRFDTKLLREIVRFSAPVGVGWIAMFILHFGDRFILPRYRSLDDLGIYALAYKIGMLVSTLYGSFHSYWSAQVPQVLKRPDAHALFARLSALVTVGLLWISLALITAAHPVLLIMSKPAFHGAAQLLPLVVGAYFCYALGNFFRGVLLAQGRTGVEAVCLWVGAAICLTGYLWLIPPYGAWGAASATFAAFAVSTAVSIIWAYRSWPFPVETARLAKAFAIAAALLTAHALMPATSLAMEIAWSAAVITGYPLLLWLARFPTPAESELVTRYLPRFR